MVPFCIEFLNCSVLFGGTITTRAVIDLNEMLVVTQSVNSLLNLYWLYLFFQLQDLK